ncbi:TrkA family potassium uptake protein [Streptomyces ipomoeae]|uniref:TrkA-C domain protein n=2 Tax=Streptomyces ipomoeae TaxID=103232 RepID=L1KWP6_9ACTN|nr:TrkA family potassium uptake protein [Streptomyces ipomoeae]EKX65251.1 TrkA-C domain protein [Streptomyces ipomoeae 91-03]MDX2695692.1 TrkA family potassium uptake protein [Streptomyces ipomoeae]MDX2823534.1 TrkA family potassium uptake protein [Streptomyces ipomoeae]MDX2842745.1 TrkA family potassium uptake protein [Streptomyces ipomoeae]MDX2877275.1 TrkA family potassium uptake protein [Streptomyces ipomoeae]
MADYLKTLLVRRRRLAAERRPSQDSKVAVIGLGRFGHSVALELMRRGWDVLGVDADAGVVQRVGDELTHAAAADCTDPHALDQLGVNRFSRVVVGIGTDLEASILTTSNLVDAGVPNIWARATSRQHGQILERVGAHHVVLPEHDMGERVAHLVTGRMLDFITFDSDYALIKTLAPKVVGGVPLGESRVRSTYGVTVVGVKRPGADFTHATAETVVQPGDVIIVTGRTRAVETFAELE